MNDKALTRRRCRSGVAQQLGEQRSGQLCPQLMELLVWTIPMGV